MAVVKAISSRDNPLLVRLRKLAADPGGYRRLGEIWLEGDHLCSAFLQRGGVPAQAVITEAAWEEPRWREIAGRAAAVAVLPQTLMSALSTLESPPPIGFVVPWEGAGALAGGVPSVVLDRLQDAGNVGTILRSAAALGVEQVIALKGTTALWSPKVLRAAMGAHFGLRLVEGAAPEALDALGVPLVATSSHAPQRLHEARLPRPCAWLLGHEGQGIDSELLGRCALTVGIPQPGGEESLNVASAAAICFYEALRQRSLPDA
ncbi:TrmH family RNA methyltransferase [Piscinibacter sp.]|uniref:TrmH family RNA methyltransferase n=1 Tax=Piscinibacter sp. TaxID=1903157 RepID=UPI002D10FCA5|nr:RNA methyltransferase [Albitalea sp.]HUG26546.1 RNA methyltransferase [Albitalea sp.]